MVRVHLLFDWKCIQ